jgi:glycosyltransferase involved in cell wall biosynthesis
MASGLPVVVADAGGPKDIVEHNVNGLKCKPQDALDYYHSIVTIINSAELKEKFIKNSLEFVKSLNWESLCEEYFNIVSSLKNNA